MHVPPPRNKVDNTPRQPSEFLTEPILVRLLEDVPPLPKGLVYSLPAYEATRLIYRRVATAVGSLSVLPDITLSEQECAEAGL
jgi:hypothetical protein